MVDNVCVKVKFEVFWVLWFSHHREMCTALALLVSSSLLQLRRSFYWAVVTEKVAVWNTFFFFFFHSLAAVVLASVNESAICWMCGDALTVIILESQSKDLLCRRLGTLLSCSEKTLKQWTESENQTRLESGGSRWTITASCLSKHRSTSP